LLVLVKRLMIHMYPLPVFDELEGLL